MVMRPILCEYELIYLCCSVVYKFDMRAVLHWSHDLERRNAWGKLDMSNFLKTGADNSSNDCIIKNDFIIKNDYSHDIIYAVSIGPALR